MNGLNAIDGISCVMPKGAFYAFPNITQTGLSSREFADRLLEEFGVAGIAGTSFGDAGEGYIRLSYANSEANLQKAIERVAAMASAVLAQVRTESTPGGATRVALLARHRRSLEGQCLISNASNLVTRWAEPGDLRRQPRLSPRHSLTRRSDSSTSIRRSTPGRRSEAETVRTIRSDGGSRIGFKGKTYESVREKVTSYNDAFADYWAFLEPRLEAAYRLLAKDGTLYLHLDYREAHYAKVLLDALFGIECFLNEIIWAYDYGGKSRRQWPTKHDTILVYVKDPDRYYFNSEAVDREPYMAPGLVTPEKAARGKLPTDVWWHTIVSPTGREKTGYATQKPEAIVRRMVQASAGREIGCWTCLPGAGRWVRSPWRPAAGSCWWTKARRRIDMRASGRVMAATIRLSPTWNGRRRGDLLVVRRLIRNPD